MKFINFVEIGEFSICIIGLRGMDVPAHVCFTGVYKYFSDFSGLSGAR